MALHSFVGREKSLLRGTIGRGFGDLNPRRAINPFYPKEVSLSYAISTAKYLEEQTHSEIFVFYRLNYSSEEPTGLEPVSRH
jgi:hypothetical protein